MEFTPSVTLYNGDGYGIHNLVGSEAFAALGTFAAAFDARTAVIGTGVENTGILIVTGGTFHK